LEEHLQGNERGAEALGSAPLFKLTFAEFDMMSYYLINLLFIFVIFFNTGSAQMLRETLIFEPDPSKHGHTHASCIVECPNGDLLACWYEGETDRSADVHIQAARLTKGKDTWSETFLLADTPTLSDNNPCMIIDNQDRLWLFYFTLLGSPEEAWETAFIRYKISMHYQDQSTPIIWDMETDLPVKPNALDETISKLCQEMISNSHDDPKILKVRDQIQAQLKSQLARKLGWTIRAHPIILSSGTLLLPMASEIFGVAAMAITSDGGKTWTFSKPLYGYGVEQPSVFERTDGILVAYLRDATLERRIRMSQSNDAGFTWSPITNTDFPNPGSGVEVLRLSSGNIALIYNDCAVHPRNSLAISMSDDEGKSWQWTRHIERVIGEGRFDYPSIIQTSDGMIHATFSYNLKTIKHVVFNEEWIKAGD
jgi:predicted neuraminidase